MRYIFAFLALFVLRSRAESAHHVLAEKYDADENGQLSLGELEELWRSTGVTDSEGLECLHAVVEAVNTPVSAGSEVVNASDAIHEVFINLVLTATTGKCGVHVHDHEEHEGEEHEGEGHEGEEHEGEEHEGEEHEGEEHEGEEHEGEDHEHESPGEHALHLLLEEFSSDPASNSFTVSDLKKIYSALINPTGGENVHDHDHDNHDGHAHARRGLLLADGHAHNGYTCLGADHIVHEEFQVPEEGVVSITDLPRLVGLLESMLVERVEGCGSRPVEHKDDCDNVSTSERWGYTVLAVLLVSLLALVLILVAVPVLSNKRNLQLLLAFAIGALLGDVFYHIIPVVLGVHSHGGDDHEGHAHHDEEPISQRELNTKMTIVLLTILFFYYIDWGARALLGGKEIHEEVKAIEPTDESAKEATDESAKKPWNHWTPMTEVPRIVWVVVVADGMHNLTDGLSIGASFSKSVSFGWTTTVAVMLHEIPQEVGDFAILLGAGLSIFQAVVLNFISACTCLVAGLIAAGIGASSSDAEEWMLCVTVGSFLYLAVALVTPELLQTVSRADPLQFLLHTLGMVSGGLVMWVIAITEDEGKCAH